MDIDIKSLEINLFKASEIKDGDTILIKVDPQDKKNLSKENIENLYKEIKKLVKDKDIGIYFFPKNLDINMIKTHVENIEKTNLKEKIS